jgi:uncharacterized membrane protein
MIPFLSFQEKAVHAELFWASVVFGTLLLFVSAAGVNRTGRRLISLLLRAILFVSILILAFRGVLVFSTRELEKRPLAVAVDRSQSMTSPVFEKETRWDEVRRFLNDPIWKNLSNDFELEVFEFSGDSSPSSIEKLKSAAPPEGDETKIGEALRSISGQKEWTGLILISDGVSTSAEENPTSKIPVITLYPETAKNLKDVAILSVRAPETAYLKSKLSIDVEVEATGVPKNNLRLRVYDMAEGTGEGGDRLLLEQEIASLQWKGDRAIVPMTLTLESIGKNGITVEATRFPEEVTYENNEKAVVINVLRDRTRILHVAGRPSWDERFLREYLKNNANIDLISFFILRNPGNNPEAQEGELSLIPFPYQDLFSTELNNFDLVVFQNFDFKTYFSSFYLQNIRSYVEQGGAFVMIGGDLSFGKGGYEGTPVEEILPIRVRNDDREIALEPFHPILTLAGQQYPLLPSQLRQSDFQSLPVLRMLQRAAGLHEDSVTLLAHPSEKLGASPAPLLVVRQVERGRVAALLTDSLWNWAFSEEWKGPRMYRDVWNGLYRWLVRDPASSLIRITSDEPWRSKGAQSAQITVLDRKFQPLQGATPKVTFRYRNEAAAEQKVGSTDRGGQVTVSTPPLRKGLLEVKAKVPGKLEEVYTAREIYQVEGGEREFQQRTVDTERMQSIADRSGGASSSISNVSSRTFSPLYRQAKYRLVRQREIPLWDHAGLLWLGLLAATIEWWFRRRYGGA